jgi:hypothetical protein
MKTITAAAVKAQRQNTPLYVDVAGYLGPVTVTKDSLVATVDIKAGTLLFTEKAVEATFESGDGYELMEPDSKTGDPRQKNWVLNVVSIMAAVQHDSELAGTLYGLAGVEVPAGIVDPNAIASLCRDRQWTAEADFLMTEYQIEKLGQDRQEVLSGSRAAAGLWPLASRAKHACAANAFRTFYGDFLTVYATEDISAGSEITLALWPAEMTLPMRTQKSIEKYGRECDCRLCAEDRADQNLLKRFELQFRFRALEGRREERPLRDIVTEQDELMRQRIGLYGARTLRPGLAEDAAVIAGHYVELKNDKMGIQYNRIACDAGIDCLNVKIFSLFRMGYCYLRMGDRAMAERARAEAEEVARIATGCTKEIFEMVYRADLSSYGMLIME